jgi:hypothetical protein
MGRGLLRWLLNVVVGPPLGFIACVVTMMLLLIFAQPGEMQSRIDGAMIFGLFAAPFIMISHVFGLIPSLLIALCGTILDRVIRGSGMARVLAILVIGGLITYGCAYPVFGRQDYPIQVGSQDLFFTSIVVGGAVAAFLCALLVEWLTPIRPAVPASGAVA